MMRRVFAGGCLLFASCLPARHRPGPPPVIPARFVSLGADALVARDTVVAEWWRGYGDPVLDSLVTLGLRANADLEATAGRLAEATASLRVAGGALLPSATNTASATASSQVIGNFGTIRTEVLAQTTSASWELDVLGKLRDDRRAAAANLRAAGYDLADLQRTITGRIVRRYLDAVSARDRVALTQASIGTLAETATLLSARMRAGLSTRFDVVRADASRDDASASVATPQSEYIDAVGELTVLCGSTIETIQALVKNAQFPTHVPEIPGVGVPVDQLRRRPDVRAAEMRVVEAALRVNVARKSLLPSLSLTGAFGRNRTGSNPWASTWSFGPSLAGTLFSGSARGALDQRRAQVLQREAAWRGAVTTAARDVEVALGQLMIASPRLQWLDSVVAHRREGEQLALVRWRGGLTDVRDVLDAQRTVIDATQAQLRQRATIAQAMATLYQALGGGVSLDVATTASAASPSTATPPSRER